MKNSMIKKCMWNHQNPEMDRKTGLFCFFLRFSSSFYNYKVAVIAGNQFKRLEMLPSTVKKNEEKERKALEMQRRQIQRRRRIRIRIRRRRGYHAAKTGNMTCNSLTCNPAKSNWK